MTTVHRPNSPRFNAGIVDSQHREVRCPRCGIVKLLGRDRVLSAHRTSEGVVTYLRCHCGGLVIAMPDSPSVHAWSRSDLDGA